MFTPSLLQLYSYVYERFGVWSTNHSIVFERTLGGLYFHCNGNVTCQCCCQHEQKYWKINLLFLLHNMNSFSQRERVRERETEREKESKIQYYLSKNLPAIKR